MLVYFTFWLLFMYSLQVNLETPLLLIKRRKILIVHLLDLLSKKYLHRLILPDLLYRLQCSVQIVRRDGHLLVLVEKVTVLIALLGFHDCRKLELF